MNDALSIESLMLDIMSTRKIIDRLSRNLTNRQIFNESNSIYLIFRIQN